MMPSCDGEVYPSVDQLLGDRDEVVEHVLLLLAHPRACHASPYSRAAAHVDGHPDAAELEPGGHVRPVGRQRARPRSRRSRTSSPAWRRRAAGPSRGDEDRDPRAVLRRGEHLPGLVAARSTGGVAGSNGVGHPRSEVYAIDGGRLERRGERHPDVGIGPAAVHRRHHAGPGSAISPEQAPVAIEDFIRLCTSTRIPHQTSRRPRRTCSIAARAPGTIDFHARSPDPRSIATTHRFGAAGPGARTTSRPRHRSVRTPHRPLDDGAIGARDMRRGRIAEIRKVQPVAVGGPFVERDQQVPAIIADCSLTNQVGQVLPLEDQPVVRLRRADPVVVERMTRELRLLSLAGGRLRKTRIEEAAPVPGPGQAREAHPPHASGRSLSRPRSRTWTVCQSAPPSASV